MGSIQNYSNNKTNAKAIHIHGFSLVEILLVIALFSMFAFTAMPMVGGVVSQNDLESSSLMVVSTLRQAENNARNGIEDSTWSVRIAYPQLKLFKGSDYATRDLNYDVDYTLNSNLTLSGISTITYSKMYAIPSTTGNIIMTNQNNSSVIININAKGRLSY